MHYVYNPEKKYINVKCLIKDFTSEVKLNFQKYKINTHFLTDVVRVQVLQRL